MPLTPPEIVSRTPAAALSAVSVVPLPLTVRALVWIVRDDNVLFWMMPVTLLPMPPLITFAAVPAPELVMVPLLLTLVPESVIAAPAELSVMLPLPVMPPLKARLPLLAVDRLTSWALSVTGLLNVTVTVLLLAMAPMVARPLLPEATVIGLGMVPLKLPWRVAAFVPPLSPRVIKLLLLPKAVVVLPLSVPLLISTPPLKVLALQNPLAGVVLDNR